VSVDLDLQINATIEEIGDFEPTTLVVLTPLELAVYDHYVPPRVVIGAAWSTSELWRVYADAIWTGWEQMPLNVAQIRSGALESQLLTGEEIGVVDGNTHVVSLGSVWSWRMGSELSLPQIELSDSLGALETVVRAGWAMEPTPLQGLGEGVSMVDSDRMVLTGGLGVTHGSPFESLTGPVSWDVFAEYQLLANREVPVSYSDPYAPGALISGDSIPVGGSLWGTGLQLRLDY